MNGSGDHRLTRLHSTFVPSRLTATHEVGAQRRPRSHAAPNTPSDAVSATALPAGSQRAGAPLDKRSRRGAGFRVGVQTNVRSPEVVSRVAAILLCGLVLLMGSSTSAASPRTERGSFLLVALPALGTVTWRCDPSVTPGVAPGLAGMALGFRAFSNSATDHVRLRAAGRTIRNRVVQPGETVEFPYVQATRQRLDFVQQTGAGTLRASVRVDFVPRGATTYCHPYLPPRVDVGVGPRR